jgi:hypothetical protein
VSYQRSAKQKVTRKARRIQDRELARIERERRAKRAKRRKAELRVAAVVAALAVVVGAGFGVRAWIASGRTGPTNMASDGLLLVGDGSATHGQTTAGLPDDGTPTPTTDLSASGVTQVVAYVDYADPASAAFWHANGAALESMLTSAAGQLTLEIHPVAPAAGRSAFTPTPTTPAPTDDATASATPTPTPTYTPNDEDAGYDYALRAANAFACVAALAPDDALAVNDALFDAQATFGTAGLSDDDLVALVSKAGVTAGGTEKCLRSHRYERWVGQATDRATLALPFDGVSALAAAPLVVVAGQEYTGAPDDSTQFLSFLLQVADSLTTSSSSDTGTEGTAPTESATEPADTTAPTP